MDAAWNAFVETNPHASFYHRAEWRGINQRNFGHRSAYLAAVEGTRVVGVYPIVQLKSLMFGNLACSMPFVNYGGPVADSSEVERQLLDAGDALANDWGVDYVEIRSRHSLGGRYATSSHKVSMTVRLGPDPDVLWKGFSSGQRNEIRRAYKHGFTVKFGTDRVDDFYAVLSDSWRDLGTPIYRPTYIKDVVASFPGTTRICVVYAADGTPAAAAFDGVHNGTVEGMWLGTRAQFRRQLVGYVLYWELIKHACEQGHQVFHLGRSTVDSGGEQFKKKWNAESMPLYWQYLLRTRQDTPSLNVTNPKFQLAIQAWRRLPVSVTQMIGPFIARSIP